MKKFIVIAFSVLFFCVPAAISQNARNINQKNRPAIPTERAVNDTDQRLARAFVEHESNLQIEGRGMVTRILRDDNDGSRHQRFIIELKTGQTLLIAHNIDLAPRIDSLEVGDEVAFFGEYEWNPKGGAIHWTHRDPSGHHIAGWLKHKGKKYQ